MGICHPVSQRNSPNNNREINAFSYSARGNEHFRQFVQLENWENLSKLVYECGWSRRFLAKSPNRTVGWHPI